MQQHSCNINTLKIQSCKPRANKVMNGPNSYFPYSSAKLENFQWSDTNSENGFADVSSAGQVLSWPYGVQNQKHT